MIACVAGVERGRGQGGREKEKGDWEEGEGDLPSIFPFNLPLSQNSTNCHFNRPGIERQGGVQLKVS